MQLTNLSQKGACSKTCTSYCNRHFPDGCIKCFGWYQGFILNSDGTNNDCAYSNGQTCSPAKCNT